MTTHIFNNHSEVLTITHVGAITAPGYHNSHITIFEYLERERVEKLLEGLRGIEGVSDVGLRQEHTIDIGTRSPTEPMQVLKKVLGLLQESDLINEEDIRGAYETFRLEPSIYRESDSSNLEL